jgi:hypothetical protein
MGLVIGRFTPRFAQGLGLWMDRVAVVSLLVRLWPNFIQLGPDEIGPR